MIILISGSTHSGKTYLSQKLLEELKIPYLSIDHLKMGLIRSKNTTLTPNDDLELTNYLWPIIREIIKTNIENKQNIIIEGCYIPCDFLNDFSDEYKNEINHIYLIYTKEYIDKYFSIIKKYANIVENRLDDSDLSKDILIKENINLLKECKERKLNFILINDDFKKAIEHIIGDFKCK